MRSSNFNKGVVRAIACIGLVIVFIMGNSAGCIKDETEDNSSGCGTVMGCCPATGCGTKWYGSSTRLCYNTTTDCHNAGNSNCRQCY